MLRQLQPQATPCLEIDTRMAHPETVSQMNMTSEFKNMVYIAVVVLHFLDYTKIYCILCVHKLLALCSSLMYCDVM